ncbi:SDR family oxidoreductase [Streptomyces hoynatensis]|uniref:SDR family oxidoreductase n=1 Tax=Streptomyces hoynatensis TaxID=1141874 RepID=A0A3A9ZFS3_9ACTN|nr:SDR family oxidoreductase [Streptomyces hoynatensis]RKN47029.1 SDR family oxidoreductase [Streptomyces hoynatensis]
MRVVVMGGTSGIGLETARRQAAAGAEVIVTGRDPERLAAAKDVVAAAEQVDGTVEAEVSAFFERVGEFDHLVLAFSPGALGLGPVKSVELAQIRAAFEGKLFPYLQAVQQARVTGSITMVSAASARANVPGTVTFAAVNGAIDRIVSPLAAELAPVRVNAVAPGAVDTNWWSFLPEEQRTAQFAAAAETVPAKRIGHAEDIAEAIGYLIGATYVTGKVLVVDGGFTAA